ncbi:MAG: hypothetical protein ABI579_08645 [Candidatus Sumerlaeota bacterium]
MLPEDIANHLTGHDGKLPNNPFGGIRFDPLFTQAGGRVLPPLSKGCLPKIQPLPRLADRRHDQVNMRMALVGVQGHGVVALQSKLIGGELSNGGLEFSWGGGSGHREHQIVHKL